MLDVSTKSLIIDISPSDEIKKRSFFFIVIGQSLGRAFPFFLYLILMNNIHSINSWTTFFVCSYIILLPLLGSIPFIKEKNKSLIIENFANFNISDNKDLNFSPRPRITFILLCIFEFFAFSDAIFAYAFFPYLLDKFGMDKFNLFNFFLIFYFLISIISSAIGTFLIKKIKTKTIILVLIPLIGIIYILYTIVDFILFTLLYFIGSSLATITNLHISVYIMKFKTGNKSMRFHLISSFRNLSIFIFLPLGTLLSSFIPTEYLIVIGAITLNLCIIPLIYIKI